MTIIEYDPTKEITTIKGRCDKCNNVWIISNDGTYQLPLELKEKCPKCGEMNILFYPDKEMDKEILRQKYVLALPAKLENAKKTIENQREKIKKLEESIEKLTTENGDQAHAIKNLTAFLDQIGVKLDERTNKLAG